MQDYHKKKSHNSGCECKLPFCLYFTMFLLFTCLSVHVILQNKLKYIITGGKGSKVIIYITWIRISFFVFYC